MFDRVSVISGTFERTQFQYSVKVAGISEANVRPRSL
jgi:hypothetical protein